MKNLNEFITEAIRFTRVEDIDIESVLDSFSEIKNKSTLNSTIISTVISNFRYADADDIVKFLDWIKKNRIKITLTETEFPAFLKTILKILSKAKYNKIIDLGFVDTSKITDMDNFFPRFCKCSIDVSKWDVSKVKKMYGLFSTFRGDIIGLDKWNVSNVEDMSSMFSDCGKFSSDITKWNTSKVEKMYGMFSNCDFNQDISKWDVSKVTVTAYMFYYSKTFNQDISGWDISSLDQCNYMFCGCKKFNQDLSSWDFSKGVFAYDMLGGSGIEKSPEKYPAHVESPLPHKS